MLECCLGVFAIGGMVFTILTVRYVFHVQRLAAGRRGENYDSFSAAFTGTEVPDEVLRAAYAEFQLWNRGAVEKFPVRAADDIAAIYRMENEDVNAVVMKVLAECGRRLPTPTDPNRDDAPVAIRTVSDLVHFVATCPKVAEPHT